MDFKILMSAFTAVFFAELADKTQLVGLGLSAKTGKPMLVFLGSVLAYSVIILITVILGSFLNQHIRPEYIRIAGGCIFVVMGILMLANRI